MSKGKQTSLSEMFLQLNRCKWGLFGYLEAIRKEADDWGVKTEPRGQKNWLQSSETGLDPGRDQKTSTTFLQLWQFPGGTDINTQDRAVLERKLGCLGTGLSQGANNGGGRQVRPTDHHMLDDGSPQVVFSFSISMQDWLALSLTEERDLLGAVAMLAGCLD